MTDAAMTEQELVEWAASFGPLLAEHAERHDREGSFVIEAHEALRESGLLAIGVPTELGGKGASIRQVTMVQRELAKSCGSTALCTAMHQHPVQFAAWRYRRGMPGADVMLKNVLENKAVVVTTGGADFTRPRGTATKVDGGFRITGHKIFCSQAPNGSVMSTLMPYDDPEQGKVVLTMSIPFGAEGMTILDNWDTLGMRGTGSNDVTLEDVFVPDGAVGGPFPFGVLHPPLQVIASIALPIISGVYLGVAEAAYANALEAAAGKKDDRNVQRTIGLMKSKLRIASWALDGALAAIGDDPMPSMHSVAAAGAAKLAVATAGIEVCDLAMEVVGGAGYFKGSPVERAYRDIRAIKFHPLQPENTLLHAGQVELGLPAEDF
jgi:alkylation response protein AidB-like acyl-CoA dehydrogenase